MYYQIVNGVIQLAGAVKGTSTNDNAVAGNYGEYLVNSTGGGTTATVTITIAAPGVITWAAHGLNALAPIYLSTSGALPTGLSAFTGVYVTAGSVTANTFQVSTTMANALAGISIATTGTQSGTQTGHVGFIQNSGSPADIIGLSLLAGDYDVTGVYFPTYGGATSITAMAVWLGTAGGSALPYSQSVAATMAASLLSGLVSFGSAAIVQPQTMLQTGTIRISLAAPGMAVLSTQATYTASSISGYGMIRARRSR